MKTCTIYIKNAVLQKKEKLSPVQIKHVFQNAIDGVGHRNKIGKVPELGLSGQEIPLRWRMKNDDIIGLAATLRHHAHTLVSVHLIHLSLLHLRPPNSAISIIYTFEPAPPFLSAIHLSFWTPPPSFSPLSPILFLSQKKRAHPSLSPIHLGPNLSISPTFEPHPLSIPDTFGAPFSLNIGAPTTPSLSLAPVNTLFTICWW